MENHGLIVNCDDAKACVRLHDKINKLIRREAGIKMKYPKIKLVPTGTDRFESRTPFIGDFVVANGVTAEYFDAYSLYPDQLVYLNGNIAVDGPEAKLSIDTKTGRRVYATGQDEAQTIEETLLGYFYVIENVKRCGLTLKTMTGEEIGFIKNWESESYRKSLLNKKP
jgi:hypothetical protein